MSLPSFCDPNRVGKLFAPDIQAAVEGGIARRLPAASEEDSKIALVLVDMQIDFIHRDGALSVPGAIDDCRRVIEWIFRNVDAISKIFLSRDSHYPLQIFFSTWWRDAAGDHPPPYTVITAPPMWKRAIGSRSTKRSGPGNMSPSWKHSTGSN